MPFDRENDDQPTMLAQRIEWKTPFLDTQKNISGTCGCSSPPTRLVFFRFWHIPHCWRLWLCAGDAWLECCWLLPEPMVPMHGYINGHGHRDLCLSFCLYLRIGTHICMRIFMDIRKTHTHTQNITQLYIYIHIHIDPQTSQVPSCFYVLLYIYDNI